MMDEETKALLLMNRLTNYSARQKRELFQRFESALGVFASRAESEAAYGKPFKVNGKVLAVEELSDSAAKEYGYCVERGIEILEFSGARYPARLRGIDDPPLALFARGRLELLSAERSVALVGSRKASNAGFSHAYRIAGDLAGAGTVVVSGLALGVDLYAHRGALEAGGATVAVLGNGIDVVYPKENARLYTLIGREGCVVSEYPVGTGPLKQNFPRRNRVISGLSAGVVVVEAGEASGALITAAHAREQGRVVMALPGKAGSVNFSGNNRLIKEGAHLVEDAADVLACLENAGREPGGTSRSGARKRPSGLAGAGAAGGTGTGTRRADVSPLSGDILRVIGDEKVHIETIERILGSPVSRIASELTLLELRGLVVQHPGKIFSRVG
jgi:DNA processing protein